MSRPREHVTRARPGARTTQIIELWRSGELARVARETPTQAAAAHRLDMTVTALENAVDRARRLGHEIPPWRLLRSHNSPDTLTSGCEPVDDDFDFEEPTRPRAPAIGIHTSTVQYVVGEVHNSGTEIPNSQQPSNPAQHDASAFERWPHVEAFDAVGDEPIPLPVTAPHQHARSTLIDSDGNVRLQWIKTRGGLDPQAVIAATKRALADSPRHDPQPAPEYDDDDLLSVIAIGDAHFGMLAWSRESGASFDLEIAERQLVAAIDKLAALSPPSRRALLINVGDFVHADSQSNTTTRGTRVDVDGRWTKIIETAVRVKRRCIDSLLAKHEGVIDWNVRGNHDEASSMVMSIALAQYYEREPRVSVEVNPSMFSWYRFGENLIGATHGDKAKPRDLVGVMANDRRRDWGETKHRRIYCGHYHHQIVHEIHGVVIEYVPTLAGLDAWHHGMGYRAGREIRLDVIHRNRGLVERRIVGIDQLEGA